MVSCSDDMTLYNGKNFTLWVNNGSWVQIHGETSGKISVKTKTTEITDKDTTGTMMIPTGYDWNIDGEHTFSKTDTGQEYIRDQSLLLGVKQIAWKYPTATTGYYGYATFSWDAAAPNQDKPTFTFSAAGCGNISDA